MRSSPECLVQILLDEGIRDRRVIEAFRRVPREAFVPRHSAGLAYEDRPIQIAHDQVTTQPSLIARMVEGLRLTGSERVLEIGTGLGFQAAILATVAAEVFSIERFADLAEQARANLTAAGISNATVLVGDGTRGLPDHAPFHAIVSSAAAPEVPPPLVAQVAAGGRLVHPVGPGGRETVVAFRNEDGRLVEEEQLTDAFFVKLIGEYGLPEDG
ncbi:MAG: protein-L-isoaspartate(D-aspartate) O-methyltransferase [Actinomycetota bacterium]